MVKYIDLLLLFTIYSFLGWTLETVYASINARKIINRGFLTGFVCPIYGFSAILIIQLSKLAASIIKNQIVSLIMKILLSILVITILEYITGWILEKIFHSRWWDYTDDPFNIKGYICLEYSLLWGLLSFLFIQLIHPIISQLVIAIPVFIKDYIAVGLFIYFLVDIIKSVIENLDLRKAILGYSNISIKEYYKKNLNKEEHKKCIDELFGHEMVGLMDNFMQHGEVSCLQHSLSVSYYSYIICRLLGFDYHSAARGGLLHDFFLYDWHGEKSYKGLHGFAHPKIALQNANQYFNLNELEKDIIEKHMWPLTLKLPKYKESYVVSFVDKCCATFEIFNGTCKKILTKL